MPSNSTGGESHAQLGKRCDLYLLVKIILPPHPLPAGSLPKTQHQNARPKTSTPTQHKKSPPSRKIEDKYPYLPQVRRRCLRAFCTGPLSSYRVRALGWADPGSPEEGAPPFSVRFASHTALKPHEIPSHSRRLVLRINSRATLGANQKLHFS